MPSGVYERTPETRKKMSDTKKGKNNPRGMLGKHHSEATKKKISVVNKGKPSSMKGKMHLEETKQKMRDNHADFSGENHPMFGKKHSEEAKQKISEAHKGKKLSEEHKQKIKDNMPNRVGENNPFYGKCHSEEVKQKISNANKGKDHPMYGKHHSEETKQKMSNVGKGKKLSEETKKKISNSTKGNKNPNWNPDRAIVYAPYGENFYNPNLRQVRCQLQSGRCLLSGNELNLCSRQSYHHIDMDKSNDNPDNHVWLTAHFHGKVHSKRKREYYRKLLIQNLRDLKNGEIPKYWSQINKELFRQEKLKQLDLSSYII